MRIRKNAKFSSYYHTNLSNVANTIQLNENSNSLSCEINQSPWDIMSFPSSDISFHQQFEEYAVYYDVNELMSAGNGRSNDSIRRFESVSLKSSGIGENDNITVRTNDDDDENLGFKEEENKSVVLEEIKLCGKSDEEGWQCGNVVKNGNKVCDKHLSEVQNWTTKKKFGPDSRPMTGCRPRKAKKRDNSDHPYDFYSGFGPSWGKKRGKVSIDSNGYNAASIDYDMDVQKEKEQGLELEVTEADLMKAKMDSIAVDGEDEKGKVGSFGKKRGRKPIKERSLKSLM